MELQQLKEALNAAGFSQESLNVMNGIIDEAIANNSFTAEAKDKLLGIIDIEIESANLEADALEEVAIALESFSNEVAVNADTAGNNLEMINKELQSEDQNSSPQQSASM